MFLRPRRNRGSPVEIAVTDNPCSGGSTCLLTKLNSLLVYLQFIHPLTCFFVLIYLTACLFVYSFICFSYCNFGGTKSHKSEYHVSFNNH